MFFYNLRLSLISIRRNPVLTVLMVGAIAIGIGVSTTTLAIYHGMANNPIPGKGDQLYAVQLDSWNPDEAYRDPDEPPTQVTYRDATALIKAAKAPHQVAEYISALTLQPDNPDLKPYQVISRNTFSDFFEMFNVPFQYGGPWSKSEDSDQEQVVVLSQATNEKLFGGANSVGKDILLENRHFQITGVLKKWSPRPKFYDLENDEFGDPEDVYIPFDLTVPMKLDTVGNRNCWKPPADNSYQGSLNSECTWIQFWAELPTHADRDAYLSFLNAYAKEQRKLGRFQRPLNNHLRNVDEWLKYNQVVSNDSRALVGLAFLFLAVCMLNTVALILAKFMRRSGEIGLRRALGADRMTLFRQYLVETGLIGVTGGLLGLGLGWVGLLGVQQLIRHSDRFAHLDWTMVGTSLMLALLVSLVAGLYPTWRMVRIPPALHLRLQ